MEEILVIVICAAAAVFAGWKIRRMWTGKDGCSGCNKNCTSRDDREDGCSDG